MKAHLIVSIPLEQSWLCMDCDAVCNSAISCPGCAGNVLMSLANVLNREPERPAESDVDRCLSALEDAR